MRILVRRGTSLISDLRFSAGPVYIGRQSSSQVFLPDRAVSRQHAILLLEADNTWAIKDLGSANRTQVNSRPVVRQALHEGDVIAIADFTLEFHAEDLPTAPAAREPAADLGDTLVQTRDVVPSVYAQQADRLADRVLHIAPGRVKNLYQLVTLLCHLEDEEALMRELTKVLLEQFDAYHVWIGLRETTTGPLTCHGGLTRGGAAITLEAMPGTKLVKQAIKTESYILIPNIVDAAAAGDSLVGNIEQLRAAMAAPIMGPAGAYGVLYVDNGCDQTPYSNQDLDYLTLVSTLVAALVEHIG